MHQCKILTLIYLLRSIYSLKKTIRRGSSFVVKRYFVAEVQAFLKLARGEPLVARAKEKGWQTLHSLALADHQTVVLSQRHPPPSSTHTRRATYF